MKFDCRQLKMPNYNWPVVGSEDDKSPTIDVELGGGKKVYVLGSTVKEL